MDILKSNKYGINTKNVADGLDLLKDINDESIDAVFFDPQYRGVLDYLSYANEGVSRGKERHSLMQMDEDMIKDFIRGMARVLKKEGYLFLWIDKFHLCEGIHEWYKGTDFAIVDMVTWNKGKIGMGYRTRHKSEFLMVLQKPPVRATKWKDHSIPDVWTERVKQVHTHRKPVELQKRLISAVTEEGDFVLDAAAGSFSVLEACKDLKRNFIGCDIEEYKA